MFQTKICNGFYDVLMMSIDINSIAILNIHSVDYCCIVVGVTESEALNLLRKAGLSEKSDSLLNIIFLILYK